MKMNTLKNKVQLLTELQPDVKDRYNTLVVKYWKMFDNNKDLNECTPIESITRAYRLLIKEGTI